MAIRALGFGYTMSHEDPELSGKIAIDGAAFIYVNCFWRALACDLIRDQEVANKIADAAFNLGNVSLVAKMLQRAINECPNVEHVEEDGLIGSESLAIINGLEDSQLLVTAFRGQLELHYQNIAAANASEAQYLEGWLARARA